MKTDQTIVDWIKFFYGETSFVFSSLLRSMIMASPGCELFVADFSKIEVAVLWWMAGNEPGLKILRDGLDPYKYMAAANTGKTYAEIGDEGDERQLGKAQVLGCGFGMGWSKFQQTAWDVYRLKLTDEQSKNAVRAYREANEAVPQMWAGVEQAAIAAVEKNEKAFAARCAFFVKDGFLWIELPSGRRLAYCEPRIAWRYREFEYEEKLDDGTIVKKTESRGPFKTLEFMAVNSKTKKWSLERTWGGTLTENVVQACARDLLMHGLLAVEREGYQTLFAVHDEAVCERKAGERTIDDFVKTLCRPPTWAAGLPFEAKGWVGKRYRK